MSDAWKEPVVVWREPRYISAARVVLRTAFAFAWLFAEFAAIQLEWWWVAIPLGLGAFATGIHAALAVANLVLNKGVILRLMPSGTIEWPQSHQEHFLKRPVDFVDGPVVAVVLDKPVNIPSLHKPRVTLVGATQELKAVPLWGGKPLDLVERLNEHLEPRGMRAQLGRSLDRERFDKS